MNRYTCDADDFYVNVNLNTEMELPTSRDTVLHYFEQMRKAFPELRALVGGGAAKPPTLNDEVREVLGVPLVTGYGSSECPGVAHSGVWDTEAVRRSDGYALDLHTLSSTPLGHDSYGHLRFDTTYSAVGELLYRLKSKADPSVVPSLVDCDRELLGWGAIHFSRSDRACSADEAAQVPAGSIGGDGPQ